MGFTLKINSSYPVMYVGMVGITLNTKARHEQ
jgi:hypothetical protein